MRALPVTQQPSNPKLNASARNTYPASRLTGSSRVLFLALAFGFGFDGWLALQEHLSEKRLRLFPIDPLSL